MEDLVKYIDDVKTTMDVASEYNLSIEDALTMGLNEWVK